MKKGLGRSGELGMYEMREEGVGEVRNGWEVVVREEDEGMRGIGMGWGIEGIGGLVIEREGLVRSGV